MQSVPQGQGLQERGRAVRRVTVPSLLERSEKIVCITAYDYTSGILVDEAGVDLVLVGDSLASVIQGHPNTIPVTMKEMVYHCLCVTRGVRRALVVGDMPFMSYQASGELALLNAGRLLKEGGVGAVKLEGGVRVAGTIAALAGAEIPVMGHVGLTPQAYHRMGGHRVQGRGKGKAAGSRQRVLEDALAVEEAGAFSVVLEGIPSELAAEISEKLTIPTIGIGAGAGCDGQILVYHDLLGLVRGQSPKFVKRYADLGSVVVSAIGEYVQEVQAGRYPGPEHGYGEV